MKYQTNVKDSSFRICQIMNSASRSIQKYEVLEVSNTGCFMILEIQKNEKIRFHFDCFENYTKFITSEVIIKSQWYGDRGWAYLKMTKKMKVKAIIKDYDSELVYNQNQLITLKSGLNDGVFWGQEVDILFYVELIQILESDFWHFAEGRNANDILKEYNLSVPFI